MSRTRGINSPDRDPNDDYPTPPLLCAAICEALWAHTGPVTTVLEPSAGSGNFVRAVLNRWPKADVTALELRPECASSLVAAGATEVHVGRRLEDGYDGALGSSYDLIVGNPPFRCAEEHIRILIHLLAPGGTLAFLLRLNFLGSERRLDFWRNHQPDEVRTIVPRPSFTGTGSDGTEYALFVWYRPRGPQDVTYGVQMDPPIVGPRGWK